MITTVKIIDLTGDPACQHCIPDKVMHLIRDEEVMGRSDPEAIRLTRDQVRTLSGVLHTTHLYGIPVWEVSE